MILKKIIIGNWKMNPVSLKEAEKLATSIIKNINTLKKTEIVLCPPFLYLEKFKKSSKKVFFWRSKCICARGRCFYWGNFCKNVS